MNIELSFSLIILIISIGLLKEYLENLVVFIRFPAILNHRLNEGIITSSSANKFKLLFNSPGIWVLVFSQLILSILFFLSSIIQYSGFLIPSLILLIDVLTFFRLRYLPSSYKPLQRILLVIICIHLFFQNASISQLCIMAMALFLCLAYVSSGFQKLISSEWKTGKLLGDLWKDENWSLKRNRTFQKWTGYSIIFFEMSFPLVFFHEYLLYLYLFLGLLFHGYLYLKLHYSFFFWTFVGAYPSLIVSSQIIQSKIQSITAIN